MSLTGAKVFNYGCLASIFCGMITLLIFGFSLYQNIEDGYAAPANGILAIMTLFGFLALLSGTLGWRRYSIKGAVILALLSLPGSWLIGGLMILGGYFTIVRALKSQRKREHNKEFLKQKELEKEYNGLLDAGKLDEALVLAQQASQQYPNYAEYWQGRAKPLKNLVELMEE